MASFESIEFIQCVANIAHAMYHLNELNLSLQGRQMNVITASEKLKAFKLKLSLWSIRIAKDNLANLPSLDRTANNCLLQNVKHDIIAHSMMLAHSYDGYFSAQQWIINPFPFNLTAMSDNDNLKEVLIEMKSCQRFQLLFEKSKLDDFWCVVMEAFPNLAKEAMRMTIPFSITYFCESGFSAMMYMKNKYRSRLHSEGDLLVLLNIVRPFYWVAACEF